jgi:Uma2 family endonuclease
MLYSPIIKEILRMPNAALLISEMQTALQQEKENRKKFYETVEENTKMEFINGEIVMQSPVTLWHNRATVRLISLLNMYVFVNKLGIVGVEKLLIRLTRNDYEPDVCFFGIEKANSFASNAKIFPPPDFVVEVLSPSTEKIDREIKFVDYAAHHVAEYWIVDSEKEIVEQYFLGEDGVYELNLKAKDAVIYSKAIDKFAISIKALFDDAATAIEMQKILA